MRVLNDKVLVRVGDKNKSKLIVNSSEERRGVVHLSGTEEIEEGEEVLFGDKCETILETNEGNALILMDKDNIKIIYDKGDL